MKTLTLRNRFQGNSTIVENEFIDNYMAKANGEYVKVYLLLLRYLNSPGTSLTIPKMADCLECTEKDILRALKYWSKTGLLKIDYDEAENICGLTVGQASIETADTPEEKESPKNAESQAELRQLYFVAEQYMGKPLSVSDIQKINYFFDTLNFSIDLIEYLVEYCVENGHKSMRYIETVAHAWADAGISTVSEAKLNSSLYSKNCFAVLKAFGISGRNPAPVEINYIKKWTDEYGFTMDIILEACNRTITNTSKSDFKYADSILRNWLAKGVHHLSDIALLDAAHKQEQPSKKKATAKSTSAANNRFNNFEGRSYDILSLEQQLLRTGSSSTTS